MNISERLFDMPTALSGYSRDFLKLGLIAQIGSTLNLPENQRRQIRVFHFINQLKTDAIGHRKDAERWKNALAEKPAVSSTEEIQLDKNKRTLLIAAPRMESITTAQRSVEGRFLKLKQISGFLTVAAISLDKKPLAESESILFLHLTNVNNTNSIFGNRQMTLLRNNGTLPYLVQRGHAEISLKSPHSFRITALTADGAPLGTVPGSRSGDTFQFKADTGCFKGGVMAYHLTR